jgi:hypothetical protein
MKTNIKSIPCAGCGDTDEPSKEMELKFRDGTSQIMICTACALKHISEIVRFCADFIRVKSAHSKAD